MIRETITFNFDDEAQQTRFHDRLKARDDAWAAADREVARIMAMSDDDIIAEAGGHEAAQKIADEMRALFERVYEACKSDN